jgi:O-antigen/teichoic acid export membrane protein
VQRLTTRWRRLFGSERTFLQRAGGVAISNFVARGLSLVFSIMVARFLGPADYGVLAYGIAVSGIAAILIANAPASLARFLRLAPDRTEQTVEFASSQVLVWSAVGLTVLVTFAALAWWQRWSVLLVTAILANVAGLSVLYTHRETQRGLLRFLNIGYAYVGANIVQLVAAGVAVVAGWRSPILLLFIYGLSPIPAVLITEVLQRTDIPFRLQVVRSTRVRESAAFVIPLTVHSAASGLWFGADTIMVQHFLHEAATGTYGVAKTLANVFVLVPSGLTAVLLPTVAGRKDRESLQFLAQSAAVATLSGAGLLAIVLVFGTPLVALPFGPHFQGATRALFGLAPGMALYGLVNVMHAFWLGRGRPRLSAFSAVAGAIASVAAGLLLIPRFGLTGAGVGFACGSVVQLVVLGTATLRMARARAPEHEGAA